MVQRLRLCPSNPGGAQVRSLPWELRSLVGKLRSHLLQKKKKEGVKDGSKVFCLRQLT